LYANSLTSFQMSIQLIVLSYALEGEGAVQARTSVSPRPCSCIQKRDGHDQSEKKYKKNIVRCVSQPVGSKKKAA
jgi:hypothetical protein